MEIGLPLEESLFVVVAHQRSKLGLHAAALAWTQPSRASGSAQYRAGPDLEYCS